MVTARSICKKSDLLNVLDGLLQLLDVLLGFGTSAVGAVESDLEFVDVCLELLLALKSLCFAAGFGLETGLHRLESALMVLAAETTKGCVTNQISNYWLI
jgi:hypothetical protein